MASAYLSSPMPPPATPTSQIPPAPTSQISPAPTSGCLACETPGASLRCASCNAGPFCNRGCFEVCWRLGHRLTCAKIPPLWWIRFEWGDIDPKAWPAWLGPPDMPLRGADTEVFCRVDELPRGTRSDPIVASVDCSLFVQRLAYASCNCRGVNFGIGGTASWRPVRPRLPPVSPARIAVYVPTEILEMILLAPLGDGGDHGEDWHLVMSLVCRRWRDVLVAWRGRAPPGTTRQLRTPLTVAVTSVPLAAWARVSGCPWDEQMCSVAAGNGNLAVLQWARENDCPWNEWTCYFAARGARFEIRF